MSSSSLLCQVITHPPFIPNYIQQLQLGRGEKLSFSGTRRSAVDCGTERGTRLSFPLGVEALGVG